MKWIVELDGKELIKGKPEAHEYLKNRLMFADYYGRNLDALYDCLSEMPAETELRLSRETLKLLADQPYAYRILRVLLDASYRNPNLRVTLEP